MLRIKEAIVVEGRYDKNTLSQVVDTLILETAGFGIFRDPERMALLRRAAERAGFRVGAVEDITDECLIFSGINGRSLDPILKKLREKEATVKLKAMVTAHNQSWNVGELIKELRREHIYMNGGDRDEK